MPDIVNRSQTTIGVGRASLAPGDVVVNADALVTIIGGKFADPLLEALRRAGALAIMTDGGVVSSAEARLVGEGTGEVFAESIVPVKRGRK
jgi:hypothetical protein